MRKTLLDVQGLSKRITLHILGGTVVEPIVDVSLQVAEGEVVALVGPSGSGKSSVVKCVHRTYRPSGGSIIYNPATGEACDLTTASDRDVLRLRREEIGFVSQFLKVEPRVPALDVVARPLMATGVDGAQARERAARLLAALGVRKSLWGSFPSLFSGGEQQRVNIARGLIRRPRLLLADEPTSALDSANVERAVSVLGEARDAGTGMLCVFHDPELIRRVADRIVILQGGRVVDAGRVNEIDIPSYDFHEESAHRV